MATLTLRNLPGDLHAWLKEQADAHQRSVSKEVIALLEAMRQPNASTLSKEEKLAQLLEIGRRCAALPVLDQRSEDEILGYDEHGIPR